METFITIIIIVFAILQIILFFKLWRMTNDVRDVKKFLMDNMKRDKVRTPTVNHDGAIKIGSHIIEIKTNKQMNVISIENMEGRVKYVCSDNRGITSKTLNRDEIELFSVYLNNLK